jgi:hypothetical protein
MLQKNLCFVSGQMILVVASAALGMRYLSESCAASTEDLLFEEEYPAGITTLRLS